MRVRRVRLTPLRPGETVLRGDEAHHLARVLRARPGDPVRAFDGEGLEAEGEVRAVAPDGVTLTLEAPRPSALESPLRVSLAVALLKGDKLTAVVRAGTELGAARFALVRSRRADVPRVSPGKLARLRRVAAEAAKQSGRAVVPPVEEPAPLGELEVDGDLLVAEPGATRTVRDVVRAGSPEALTLLTGPEGGFDPSELAALRERGAVPVAFGPRVLRAETAPVAGLAALLVPEAS